MQYLRRNDDRERTEVRFSDGAAYERFMRPWTRVIGSDLVTWLTVPTGRRWLDVGCGTGLFTEVILDTASPSGVVAIDPAAAQIDRARSKRIASRADFQVGDAQALPFANGEFDVAASAFVINFIPERPCAIAEMKRVLRVDGWSPDACGTSRAAWGSLDTCFPC